MWVTYVLVDQENGDILPCREFLEGLLNHRDLGF